MAISILLEVFVLYLFGLTPIHSYLEDGSIAFIAVTCGLHEEASLLGTVGASKEIFIVAHMAKPVMELITGEILDFAIEGFLLPCLGYHFVRLRSNTWLRLSSRGLFFLIARFSRGDRHVRSFKAAFVRDFERTFISHGDNRPVFRVIDLVPIPLSRDLHRLACFNLIRLQTSCVILEGLY